MDKFSAQRMRILGEMAEYSAREPVPCRAVSITLKYPTFSDLTPDQLDYYTYWKTVFNRKGTKRAADGYVWLFVTELLNSDDPDYASSALNSLVGACANDGSPIYPELLETAILYSKIHGTPMPACSEWMYLNMLNCLLSPEITDLPPGIMRTLCDDNTAFRDPEAERVVGTVLRRYDRLLSEKRGTSVLEFCMTPVKTSFVPFTDYAVAEPPMPVERIDWKPTGFAKTLFVYLAGLFSGTETRAPLPFRDELTSMFKEIRASGKYTDSPDPFTKPDGIRIRTLGSPVTSLGPSCLCDPAVPVRSSRNITLGDVLTFGPMSPQRPESYIPSGCEHPAYGDLSRDRFAYYLYWKDSFRRGRALDTDNGYVNLFLTELINSDDVAGASDILAELYRTYGRDAQNLIGITLMDHTVINGGVFADYNVYMDKFVVNSWIGEFVHGMNDVPLDRRMLDILRSGSVNVHYMDEIPLEPFSAALRRIFAALESRSGADAVLGVQETVSSRSFYVGLNFLRGNPVRTIRYRNYLGCRKFVGFMDKAAKYAANLAKNGCSQDSRKPFSFGGVGCAAIMYEEFLLWQSRNSVPEEREIKLDLEAVKAAEEDLRQVTDMMRTDEVPDAPEEKEEERPQSERGGPWASFFSSLTGQERTYLSLCLKNGKEASAFLRETGTTRVGMEDSINGKALDTVGDTVLENGAPVEDYEQDLKKGTE